MILPITGMPIEDEDWIKYKSLKTDKSVKPINPGDLPGDFCEKACRLVDEFRRKTVNEEVEWMLYFDYSTGEVIYCWEGDEGKSGGFYDEIHFGGRNIASIHSHTKIHYSFPSPENFDILENDFEDYEIIASHNSFWIVEFKGKVERYVMEDFQNILSEKIDDIAEEVISQYGDLEDIRNVIDRNVANYLMLTLDKNICGVELILCKKEFK